jgi:hypothetical protein
VLERCDTRCGPKAKRLAVKVRRSTAREREAKRVTRAGELPRAKRRKREGGRYQMRMALSLLPTRWAMLLGNKSRLALATAMAVLSPT